jgi:MFS family permease
MLGALALMGLAAAGAGFSRPGAPLGVCLAALGLAASVYHPAGMGLISRTVVARGRALGINGVCGNVGIALTPVLAAALAARVGWQGTFRVSGVALLAAAVWFARLPIEEAPAPPAARSLRALSPAAAAAFVTLCVAAMLGGISYRGNTLAQPAFFAERVSLIGYGAATSLVYLGGIAGQYAGGIVADRYDLRWAYFLFHLASLPALLLMSAVYGTPLLGVAACFTFFSLGMQPIENSLFAQFTPERWRSTGYGLKFVLTFGVGAGAVWLVRWAQVTRGLAAVFPMLAGVVTLLLVAILVLVVLSARPVLQTEAALGESPLA